MSTPPRETGYGRKVVETYAEGLACDQSILRELNKAIGTRLVWIVAIAGFALLNINPLAEAVAERALEGTEVALLITPWVLVSLAAISAYWLLDETVSRDSIYYIVKQHSIRAFLATAPDELSDHDILAILNIDDENEEIASRKNKVDAASTWATRAEKLTLLILSVAFLWSILYPMWLLLSA